MDISALAALCHHAATIPQAGNWRRYATIVSYEFERIDDFMSAYGQLMRAMNDDDSHVMMVQPRRPRSDTVEITLYDVTFRLVCARVIVTEDGAHGVADLISAAKFAELG